MGYRKASATGAKYPSKKSLDNDLCLAVVVALAGKNQRGTGAGCGSPKKIGGSCVSLASRRTDQGQRNFRAALRELLEAGRPVQVFIGSCPGTGKRYNGTPIGCCTAVPPHYLGVVLVCTGLYYAHTSQYRQGLERYRLVQTGTKMRRKTGTKGCIFRVPLVPVLSGHTPDYCQLQPGNPNHYPTHNTNTHKGQAQ